MFAFSAILFQVALAHVSINPNVSKGSYSQGSVRVPHGCNSTATTSVTVSIPEGVTSVKAQRVPNWAMSYTMRKLAVPIVTESANLTEEVATVTWAEGNLPDNEYQDFGLTFKLPPSPDGAKFYFPTLQKCVVGETNWSELATADKPKPAFPVPSLTVYKSGVVPDAAAKSASIGSGPSSALAIGIIASLMLV